MTSSIVTRRIRSTRPAMPSISGPRSTVARSSTATPLVSGARSSSFIELSAIIAKAQGADSLVM